MPTVTVSWGDSTILLLCMEWGQIGERIEIKKSDKTTGIVKLSQVSFLEVLHRKMID